MRHIFQKTRFAATSRAFQHHRQMFFISGLKDFHFVVLWFVIRPIIRLRLLDDVTLHAAQTIQ